MPKRSGRNRRQILSPAKAKALAALSFKQKQLLAEIFGNIAVAWFGIGVISPLFTVEPDPIRLAASVIISIILTLVFIFIAMIIIRRKS